MWKTKLEKAILLSGITCKNYKKIETRKICYIFLWNKNMPQEGVRSFLEELTNPLKKVSKFQCDMGLWWDFLPIEWLILVG